MVKNWTKYVLLLLTLITISVRAQYISVNTSYNKDQLVQKLIGANNTCISVSNVTLSGWNFDTGNISDGTTGTGDLSYGFFTKGTSNFDINEGIILSTGKAKAAQGPNDNLQDYYATNWREDQDLIDILTKYNLPTDNILNATSLEFDFIANTDKISFDYMFLSEEYQKTNCKYSDAFAFLIKKADNSEAYRNIAIVPNTTSPVTSLTISGANKCPQNINYFGGYLGIDDPNNSPTNFNGQTKVLNAESSIEKGVKYHIKLVIADHGDSSGRYDSAVFLKAGSFVGSKDIGTDRLISTNNPLCEGSTLTLDATVSGATYQWFQNGNILTGETSATYTVTSEGRYEVNISSSSCNLRGAITVEYIEKAKATQKTFTNCDTNFDGNIPIKLDDLNTTIITNYKPEFVVKYYQNLTDATLSNTNTLPNNWSYNTDTTIYVRVENGVCAPEIQPIEFKLGTTLNLLTNEATPPSICDDDLDAIKSVNLKTFEPFFTTDNSVSITYFNSENDTKNNVNPISSTQNITSTGTYFLRFEKANFCPNWAKITVNIKAPKASTDLQNKTICKNTTAEVDAGTNFIYYKWSNGTEGETLHNATYGIGTHYVELTSTNGCVYKQSFTISEAVDPVIDSVIEQGNRITINVSGGTAPYEYSLNQINWQTSNIFYNLNRGIQKVYVRDSKKCSITEYEFSIIKLLNAITPNGDGLNDVLDYSDLRVKKEVKILIFDRFGKKIFSNENSTSYIWDGTENGRPLPSGSYWYILEWTEPDTNTKVSNKGWILLKNRN